MTWSLTTLCRRSLRWKGGLSRGLPTILLQYKSDLRVETRDLHVGTTGELGFATGLQMLSAMLKHGQKSGVCVRFTSHSQPLRKTPPLWAAYVTLQEVKRLMARLSRSRLGPGRYGIRQSTAGPDTVALSRADTTTDCVRDQNAIRREEGRVRSVTDSFILV